MKDIALSILARVVCELPYLLIFWVAEVVLIALMGKSMSISWMLYPGMLVVNILIVVLCDLLDQLIDRIVAGRE